MNATSPVIKLLKWVFGARAPARQADINTANTSLANAQKAYRDADKKFSAGAEPFRKQIMHSQQYIDSLSKPEFDSLYRAALGGDAKALNQWLTNLTPFLPAKPKGGTYTPGERADALYQWLHGKPAPTGDPVGALLTNPATSTFYSADDLRKLIAAKEQITLNKARKDYTKASKDYMNNMDPYVQTLNTAKSNVQNANQAYRQAVKGDMYRKTGAIILPTGLTAYLGNMLWDAFASPDESYTDEAVSNSAPVSVSTNTATENDKNFWETMDQFLENNPLYGLSKSTFNVLAHPIDTGDKLGSIIHKALNPSKYGSSSSKISAPVAAAPSVSAPAVTSTPVQTAPLVSNSPALLPENTVADLDTPAQTSSLPVSNIPAENPVAEDTSQKPAVTIRETAPIIKTARKVPIANTPTEADLASAMVKRVTSPQVLQYGSPAYLQQQQQPVDMRQWVRQKYGMSMSPAEMVQRGIMPRDYLQYW